MMLSRVGERIYWMARYLERVENTARLINVHTSLLMDMPSKMEVNWFTLVRIFDAEEAYHEQYPDVNENNIMHFLLADLSHPTSLLSSLSSVRENGRTSLDILPEEIWEQVNELYLMVKAELSAITNRRRRQNLLLKVMERCQCIWGVISNHMSRNFAYDFIQIGKHLERADMTSRILEMTSLLISDARSDVVRQYEDILWSSLLQALSAQQMYLQTKRSSVSSEKVLNFLMKDKSFPRSLYFSLKSIGHYLEYLPISEELQIEQKKILDTLQLFNLAEIPAEEIHKNMDYLQLQLATFNRQISNTWFYPDYTVE